MTTFTRFAVIICFAYSVKGQCPDSWTQFRDSCYSLSNSVEDWVMAHDVCEKKNNGHLVSIESAEENAFLTGYIRNNTVHKDVWIGATDVLHEGDYRWVETENRLTFTDWATDEPNNSGGVYEDCVEMEAGASFMWNDDSCNKANFYICETSMQGSIVG